MIKKNLTTVMLLFATISVFSQNISLGISTDFEKSADTDSLFNLIISDINKTVTASYSLKSGDDLINYGNKNINQAVYSYNKLRINCDLILLIGSVSTVGALQSSAIDVPTIAIGVIDPFLQGLPYNNGVSAKDNFSYIWSSRNIFKEYAEFKRVIDFKHLALLTSGSSAVSVNRPKGLQLLDSLKHVFSAEIDIIPLGDDIDASFDQLSPNTDAVYLTELNELGRSEISQIATELKERKLPSFSKKQWHVQQGILASMGQEDDLSQVIRKLSVMVNNTLLGRPLSEMSVILNYNERISLNLQTAKEIDLSPSFQLLFTAKLINEDTSSKPTYSLNQILEKSLANNLDIQLVYKDLELTTQDIILAQSSVLPDLALGASASQINPDNATSFSPERQSTAELTLNQLIYSEEAIASIKISKYLNEAQNYETESNILAVILDTYVLYFNVLSAKTDLEINRDNLNNSLTNLEIARVKESVGASTAADVYRWQGEVATARQFVVDAETTVLSAKLELNTLLANTLESDFEIEDVTLDGSLFESFRKNKISQMITSPGDFSLLSDFLVEESIRANPNKLSLLANLKATERRLLQNKRLLYTPSIALQAQSGYVLSRGGEGSQEVPGFDFVDYPWQVGVSLSYPIFQGKSRRATVEKSIVELDQINFTNVQLDQNLEFQVRNSLLNALRASTNINFSLIAAENTTNNFQLVQDNYQLGSVTITQLIDAQNAALQASLSNALSIYNYFVASLRVEFAVGFFSMLTPAEELEAFEGRFIQYLNDNR